MKSWSLCLSFMSRSWYCPWWDRACVELYLWCVDNMHRKLLSLLTKPFSSIKSRYSGSSPAPGPAAFSLSATSLSLFVSLPLSSDFPDHLGWRRIMNYVNEVLIMVHHHRPVQRPGCPGAELKTIGEERENCLIKKDACISWVAILLRYPLRNFG